MRATRTPSGPSVGLITVAALIVGVVVIGALALTQLGGDDLGDLRRPAAPYPAAISDGSSLGAEDADVTMIVYSDFQCVVCGRYSTEVEPLLVDRYVRSGILRIEHRNVAILGRGTENESRLAAAAATCAEEQDAYFAYHDWLFANRNAVNTGDFRPERLRAIADEVGLDRQAFDACLAGDEAGSAVDEATAEFAARGFNATPSMVIGDQQIVGLQTAEQLAAIIEAQAFGPVSPAPSP